MPHHKPIYCLGGITADIKLISKESLHAATSNPVNAFKSFGGVARNVADNLARWTHPVFLRSVVGDDAMGREILADLHAKKIDTTVCFTLKNQNTASYYAIIDADGEMMIAFVEMEIFAHLTQEHLTTMCENFPPDSLIFLDTNFSSEFLDYALKHLAQHTLCIDAISVIKGKKLPQDLTGAYVLKVDEHEAEGLTGLPPTQAGYALLARGVKNVVVTLGPRGYLIFSAGTCTEYPAHPVDVVRDVSGAGDAFLAGIMFGLQQQKTFPQACRLGAAAAALTVQVEQTVNPNIQAEDLFLMSKEG